MCCKSMWSASYLRQNVVCLGCGPFIATEEGFGWTFDPDKPDAAVMSRGVRGANKELLFEDPDPSSLRCPKCGEMSVVAELGIKPITVYENKQKFSAWEIYEYSGPGTIPYTKWRDKILGLKFDLLRRLDISGSGSFKRFRAVIANVRNGMDVVKKVGPQAWRIERHNPCPWVKEVLDVGDMWDMTFRMANDVFEDGKWVPEKGLAWDRLFNEVLNARRPVNPRMEEFMSSLGFTGEKVYISGPLALYVATHRVGLMTIKEYRHHSNEEKDGTWEHENVILPKVMGGKDLTKLQKVILWQKSEMPLKEIMSITGNFGDRMKLKGLSREEVFETMFPNKSISAALTEFHEEFMGADLSAFGNVQNVPEGFKDRLPGENPEDDEANLDWGLFYDRMEEFTEEVEEVED